MRFLEHQSRARRQSYFIYLLYLCLLIGVSVVISVLPYGIYAYYQKQRLQKANELLLSGKFSIKQAAFAVGYNSMGNFTLAYKKQYKKMPDNILADY